MATTGIGPTALPTDFDVARKCNFRLTFVSQLTGVDLDVIGSPYPKVGSNEIEINYHNSKILLAGKADHAKSYSIKLRARVDGIIIGKLRDWSKRVYDPASGIVGKPKDYMTNAEVTMLDPQGVPVTGATFVLNRCWPKSIDFGDADMGSGDPVEITLDLNVSWVTLQY